MDTRAYGVLLDQNGLTHKREQKSVINFGDRKIGRYFIDFVVQDKVVVELKVANNFYLQHMKQVLGYLKAAGIPVGLIIAITKNGVLVKRLVNTKSANISDKNQRA